MHVRGATLVILALVLACVSGGTDAQKTVLVVVDGNSCCNRDDLSSGDTEWWDRFEKAGYQPVGVAAGNATLAMANASDLVFVSRSVFSGDVGSTLTATTTTLIVTENRLFDDLLLTGGTVGTDLGVVSSDGIYVADSLHPLAAGQAGTITLLDSDQPLGWGVPGPEATVVAYLSAAQARATIFVYETGALLADGSTPAPGKRVALFWAEPSPVSLTGAVAEAVFNASVFGSIACDAPCDDGNVCTGVSTCAEGNCVAVAGPLSCGDCQDCDPVAGCQPVSDGVACPDDGNACTFDLCEAGTCSHPERVCNDGLWCNGDEVCEPGTGACISDGLGLPCQAECSSVCVEETDSCAPDPSGVSCTSDGLDCTLDACNGAGVCAHTVLGAQCLAGGLCYASGEASATDPCYRCDAAVDQSALVFACCTTNADCDDGIFCNGAESCAPTGECLPGSSRCAGDSDGCCDEEAGTCCGGETTPDPDAEAVTGGSGGVWAGSPAVMIAILAAAVCCVGLAAAVVACVCLRRNRRRGKIRRDTAADLGLLANEMGALGGSYVPPNVTLLGAGDGGSHDRSVSVSINVLEHLEMLVRDPATMLLGALADKLKPRFQADAARSLFTVFSGLQSVSTLVAACVEHEVAMATEPLHVCRPGTLAAGVLAEVMTRRGDRYLVRTLRPALLACAARYPPKKRKARGSASASASRAGSVTAEAEALAADDVDWSKVVADVDALIGAVAASAHRIPSELVQVAAAAYRAGEVKWPGRGAALAGQIFFLHLVTPAVAVPEEFGCLASAPTTDQRIALGRVAHAIDAAAMMEDELDPVFVPIADTLEKHAVGIAALAERLAVDLAPDLRDTVETVTAEERGEALEALAVLFRDFYDDMAMRLEPTVADRLFAVVSSRHVHSL